VCCARVMALTREPEAQLKMHGVWMFRKVARRDTIRRLSRWCNVVKCVLSTSQL